MAHCVLRTAQLGRSQALTRASVSRVFAPRPNPACILTGTALLHSKASLSGSICQISPPKPWPAACALPQLRPFSTRSRALGPPQPEKEAKTQQPSPSPPPKAPLVQRTVQLQAAIKSKLTQSLAHENIYTLPNLLTFSRLALTPVIGYLILHDQHIWAVSLFAYAGVTDLVDGWIARRWNQQSVVGSVIDPMADKALMTVLTVTLAIKGLLPVWVATLILGRDVSLAIAAMYYRYASLPTPKTLARYWDFSLPSAEVHPTGISKVNTTLQLMLIGATTALPVVPLSVVAGYPVGDLMAGAQWLVAGTTLWSGLSYLYTRDAVKILGGDSPEAKLRILKRGRVVIAASFAACFVLALAMERL